MNNYMPTYSLLCLPNSPVFLPSLLFYPLPIAESPIALLGKALIEQRNLSVNRQGVVSK